MCDAPGFVIYAALAAWKGKRYQRVVGKVAEPVWCDVARDDLATTERFDTDRGSVEITAW
eukprot:7129387-Pyramimonas_sp.AAC.1